MLKYLDMKVYILIHLFILDELKCELVYTIQRPLQSYGKYEYFIHKYTFPNNNNKKKSTSDNSNSDSENENHNDNDEVEAPGSEIYYLLSTNGDDTIYYYIYPENINIYPKFYSLTSIWRELNNEHMSLCSCYIPPTDYPGILIEADIDCNISAKVYYIIYLCLYLFILLYIYSYLCLFISIVITNRQISSIISKL